MKLVNLTPHALNIQGLGPILPEATPARCAERTENIGALRVGDITIPVIRKSFGDITGLPEPAEGTVYVTSMLVAQAAARPDVMCPGDLVRDDAGNIIGCKSLCGGF